jgi:hypothetical protein
MKDLPSMGDVLGPTVSEVQRIFSDQIESSRGSLKNITKRTQPRVVVLLLSLSHVFVCAQLTYLVVLAC